VGHCGARPSTVLVHLLPPACGPCGPSVHRRKEGEESLTGRPHQRVCRSAIGHNDVAEALALDAIVGHSYPHSPSSGQRVRRESTEEAEGDGEHEDTGHPARRRCCSTAASWSRGSVPAAGVALRFGAPVRQPRRHPGWQGRARRRSQLHEQGRGKAAAASARGSGRLRRGSGHDRRGRGAPRASSFGNHGLGSRCSGGGGAQSSSAWPRQRLRLRRPSLRVLEARLRCVEAGAPCPSAGLIGVGSELRVAVECSWTATPGGYL